MATLTKASTQWSTRPADQRFGSLDDLYAAVQRHREDAAEAVRPYRGLEVIDQDGEPVLRSETGQIAEFTHWSFGQLAQRVGAPAHYLRALPAALAAENLSYGLAKVAEPGEGDEEAEAKLLFNRNGDLRVRAFTTPRYTRIWDVDIASRLRRLAQEHPEWQPAPAAIDGSRGLYASEHDIFAFMVDNDRRIFERAPGGGLARGFFAWNSEVGASVFGLMTFYYEYVCGNHRVWGASGVQELRVRHVGRADDRAFRGLAAELWRYADSSTHEDEQRIASAKRMLLGGTKDEVLDKVFGLGIARKRAAEAYAMAEAHDEWYGDPKSVWGFTGGLTEVARDVPYADERTALDRAAGKVLQIAF